MSLNLSLKLTTMSCCLRMCCLKLGMLLSLLYQVLLVLLQLLSNVTLCFTKLCSVDVKRLHLRGLPGKLCLCIGKVFGAPCSTHSQDVCKLCVCTTS